METWWGQTTHHEWQKQTPSHSSKTTSRNKRSTEKTKNISWSEIPYIHIESMWTSRSQAYPLLPHRPGERESENYRDSDRWSIFQKPLLLDRYRNKWRKTFSCAESYFKKYATKKIALEESEEARIFFSWIRKINYLRVPLSKLSCRN